MQFQNGSNKVATELSGVQFWFEIILLTKVSRSNSRFDFEIMRMISDLTKHMKKLLNYSDWLRAVQFKCNTSAKSVTPVQKV